MAGTPRSAPRAALAIMLGFGAVATQGLMPARAVAQSAAKIAGEILSLLVEVDSLGSILDGKGDMPPGTLETLKSQIAALRDERYPPVDYALSDYALSVGAIVGDGEDIVTEIEGVLAIASARQAELRKLDVRDAKLAEIETAYAVADRTLHDGAAVLLKAVEQLGGADALAGHPVFNNWHVLDQEVAPLFGDRLSEVRRVRLELGMRRKQLHDHLRDARAALRGMKSHLIRVIEYREAQGVRSEPNDLLTRMRARGAAIEAKATEIEVANAATREEVQRIQDEQAKAMREADLLRQTLAIAKLGLSIYGSVSAGGGSEGSATDSTTIDMRIDNTIINIAPPSAPPLAPQPPIELGGPT